MPVKWTPDNDQLLLLKIVETHDIPVNTKKVAEAWPSTDPSSKPTPRAITERLFKIRHMAKAAGSGDANAGLSASAPATPRKSHGTAVANGKSGATPGSSKVGDDSAKRKIAEMNVSDPKVEVEAHGDEEAGDGVVDADSPSKAAKVKRQALAAVEMGLEDLSDSGYANDTPSKRLRRATAQPADIVTYGASKEDIDMEEEKESSGSVYTPGDVKKEDV